MEICKCDSARETVKEEEFIYANRYVYMCVSLKKPRERQQRR